MSFNKYQIGLACIEELGGTPVRKLVKEYTGNDNFWEDKDLQNKAINKAIELANALNKY